eukprot:1557106-Prymnesium_polylepis.1
MAWRPQVAAQAAHARGQVQVRWTLRRRRRRLPTRRRARHAAHVARAVPLTCARRAAHLGSANAASAAQRTARHPPPRAAARDARPTA